MRYSNFKNLKGSSISISVNKNNEVETNLFGKNRVVKCDDAAGEQVAAELVGLFQTLNPCLKAIDPNNRILKNENDLKTFEAEFNSLIENAASVGFISSNEIYKISIVTNDKIQPATKRTAAATSNNGAPVYKDSDFMIAVKTGRTIILDEINLCNDEVLRALQTLSDNKQYFNYKGQRIEIKDGFKIIGTMNLSVNGCIYALPEPLVDRAGLIKEFTLNAENLALRAF